jgi:PKD repeat protein
MRTLLVLSVLALLCAPPLSAQEYSHTLAFSGSGLNNWTAFTFPNTPPTYGAGQITFNWLACYNTGSGSSIQIQFRTGESTYLTVYSENGNTQSCSSLPRSANVSANVLAAAIAYGGVNNVQGRVQILDGCAPGIGCFVNDPMLTNFKLIYTVQAAHFTSPDPTTCPGGVVQFTDASYGNPTSYAWSFPGGTPSTSDLPNPVVQYAEAGQYDVELTVTTAAGNSTVTRTNFVTVHAPPAAFAGVDQAFCAGGSAQLQASGGTAYQWIPETGLSAPNIANPVASPANSTLYTVIVTSAQGCQASDAVQVSVVPPPTIVLTNEDPVLCPGDTLTLSVSGADLYTWSPALFISATSGDQVQVWPPSTYTWTVNGSTMIGCSGQASVTVTVAPPPTTPVITWADMELSSTAAATYQWYLNGVAIPGATAQILVPGENGNYTVVTTDAFGCSATSAGYLFTSVGIATGDAEVSLRVYPVPAHDALMVEGLVPGAPFFLVDAQGRTVVTATATAARTTIDMSHLAPGTYVLGDGLRRVPVVVR